MSKQEEARAEMARYEAERARVLAVFGHIPATKKIALGLLKRRAEELEHRARRK